MNKSFAAIAVAMGLSAMAATVVVHQAGPSTAELDGDIVSVHGQIAQAEAEASRYPGGLLSTELQLRISILKNTAAMLMQKRASFLRGIVISYQDPTPRIANPADDKAPADLERARADAQAAHLEAENYTGGLIKAIAMAREATAKATEAAIEQRMMLKKLGIPLVALSATGTTAPPLPGKSASDKDAL